MLAWELEWGEMVPDFYRAWRARHEKPAALISEPTLRSELQYVLDAFWSLCADRGGEGMGALLFSSIDRYAKRIGITGQEEFFRFESLLRAMDGIWLKEIGRKRDEHAALERQRAALAQSAPQG